MNLTAIEALRIAHVLARGLDLTPNESYPFRMTDGWEVYLRSGFQGDRLVAIVTVLDSSPDTPTISES